MTTKREATIIAGPDRPRAGRRRWYKTRSGREAATFYLLISTWLFGLIFLGIGALVSGLVITFTNYDGVMALDRIKFAGLSNYARVLTEKRLGLATGNTLRFAVMAVPLGLIAQLALAVLLNASSRGKGLFRTLYYIPSVIPVVAAVTGWKVLFDKNAGLVNAVLSLHRPGTAINWLSNDYIFGMLIALTMWMGMGGGMVIFLAGLQGIPKELKEAAMIDGANGWQVVRHVTVPLLTPVVFFQLIMGTIGALQVMVQPILLSGVLGGYYFQNNIGGAPKDPIFMWNNLAMGQIFGMSRYGYGAVLLWIQFVAIALLAAVIFLTARYWVFYERES
jgi:multiple sugar transport system permease protein